MGDGGAAADRPCGQGCARQWQVGGGERARGSGGDHGGGGSPRDHRLAARGRDGGAARGRGAAYAGGVVHGGGGGGRGWAMNGMLRQTGALFLDAYREINSKKMFWVTMFLSLLVVAAFAGVGINARGIKVFVWEFPGIWNTSLISPGTFYKAMFSGVGVTWWLNVIAVALALGSTASIIPDFVAGGSIDLYLSKPISRLRL